MKDLVPYLQDAVAIAFVALGLVTAISWLRRRDRSLGFLALAIILLAAVSGLGRVQAHLPFMVPWLGVINLAGFMASAYALLLYRDTIIPLPRRWHVVAIVALTSASVSPPSWLRRQWRAPEEEGLRAFMEELLLSEDRDALARRALEWAMRLVGGASGVLFDSSGRPTAVRGVSTAQVAELGGQFASLGRGPRRITLSGSESSVMALPIAGLSGSGTLVLMAGPFTPGFGGDEMNRIQQLMSAFVTALDRRHLMAQLEQRNVALQEANRHKSVFLANMSHELRTPLNAIIGFSDLMTDAREGQFDDATRKRFLSQILTSGKHLLGLINDILDLSKVEAGQMELRLSMVSVAEAVDQVTKTVEPLVGKKNIALRVNVDGAGDVLADGGKLKQMLLNLVSNAIKFTPEEGTVTIAAVRVKDTVEISVADTGIGIADADMKEIFHEFHQVDPGPGRKHEGTGLGLALTRRFAALHGGDGRVSSQVNKGSVFTLVMPIHATVRPPSEPAVARPVNGHGAGPLVLVVEDDPAAAELLTRQLGNAGD